MKWSLLLLPVVLALPAINVDHDFDYGGGRRPQISDELDNAFGDSMESRELQFERHRRICGHGDNDYDDDDFTKARGTRCAFPNYLLGHGRSLLPAPPLLSAPRPVVEPPCCKPPPLPAIEHYPVPVQVPMPVHLPMPVPKAIPVPVRRPCPTPPPTTTPRPQRVPFPVPVPVPMPVYDHVDIPVPVPVAGNCIPQPQLLPPPPYQMQVPHVPIAPMSIPSALPPAHRMAPMVQSAPCPLNPMPNCGPDCPSGSCTCGTGCPGGEYNWRDRLIRESKAVGPDLLPDNTTAKDVKPACAQAERSDVKAKSERASGSEDDPAGDRAGSHNKIKKKLPSLMYCLFACFYSNRPIIECCPLTKLCCPTSHRGRK